MPELKKIENDSAVANYTPQEGFVTQFFAEDESGNITLNLKLPDGTIQTLSGGGGGSASGGGSFVRIDSYTPEVNQVVSYTFSGFTESVADANGTYVLTSDTKNNSTYRRVYKHTARELYLYCWDNNNYTSPPAEGTSEDYIRWGINSTPYADGWSCMIQSNSINPADSWMDNNSYSAVNPVVSMVTEMVSPASIKATAATPSGDSWSYGESVELSSSDYDPIPGYIYATADGKVLGLPVAYPKQMPSDGLIFYAPLRSQEIDIAFAPKMDKNILECRSMKYVNACGYFKGYSRVRWTAMDHNKSGYDTLHSWTLSCFAADVSGSTTVSRMVDVGGSGLLYMSLSVNGIAVCHPHYPAGSADYSYYMFSQQPVADVGSEHHYCYVFDTETKIGKLYVDGNLFAEKQTDGLHRFDGNIVNNMTVGNIYDSTEPPGTYIRNVRMYYRALSDTEVATLAME